MKNLTILEIMWSEVKKGNNSTKKKKRIKEQSLLEFNCFITKFNNLNLKFKDLRRANENLHQSFQKKKEKLSRPGTK